MSEQEFGVSNLEYDIVTTLSNLLQGQDAMSKYENDARKAGNEEVARIFADIQTANKSHAQALRQALARQMND
jgi:rubrerythrin